MDTAAHDSAEVTIAVPQVYKDYLAPRRLMADLGLLGVHIFGILVFYSEWRWGHNRAAHSDFVIYGLTSVFYIFAALAMWRRQMGLPWQYVINEKLFRLVEWQHGGRFWQWHDLDWSREVVSGVEFGEWRGLPMLSVETAAKDPKQNQTLCLVYAHEDQNTVTQQILPLIEHFRWRFRHDFWYEQLRS